MAFLSCGFIALWSILYLVTFVNNLPCHAFTRWKLKINKNLQKINHIKVKSLVRQRPFEQIFYTEFTVHYCHHFGWHVLHEQVPAFEACQAVCYMQLCETCLMSPLLPRYFLRTSFYVFFWTGCWHSTLYLPLQNVQHTPISHSHDLSSSNQTNMIYMFLSVHWCSRSRIGFLTPHLLVHLSQQRYKSI